MFKVQTRNEFTNDQIAGLLCTAFEGGLSSQWAEVIENHTPVSFADFKQDWAIYPLYSYPLGVGGCVMIRDVETNKEYKLNRAAINRGLKLMAEKYPTHYNDFVNENDDAVTGDVFLQCCVLGDVLYG